MKKVTLLFFAVLTSVGLSAQIQEYGIGLGLSKYSIDTKKASNIGMKFSGFVGMFYFDLCSNMASGKGKYLEFQSSQTYKIDKINMTSGNIGLLVPIKKFRIIPNIGLVFTKPIYQDPILFMSYFYGKSKMTAQVGIYAGYHFDQGYGVHAGFGTEEIFNLTLVMFTK